MSLSLALFPLQQLRKQKKTHLLNDKRCYCVVENACESPTQWLFLIDSHMNNITVPTVNDLGCNFRFRSDLFHTAEAGRRGFSTPVWSALQMGLMVWV